MDEEDLKKIIEEETSISRNSLKNRIWQALEDPKMKQMILAALKYEMEMREKHPDKEYMWEWELSDIGMSWAGWVIRKLMELGIVKRTYESRAHKYYRLRDYELTYEVVKEYIRRKIAEKNGKTVREEIEEEKGEEDTVPEDIFDIIEGHDDIKELFKDSLKAVRHHILLVGPPAVAKTLFLQEISKLPGAVFIDMAGRATKTGIAEILLEYKPRYLLIDEIDKVQDKRDLTILLNVMETGILRIVKHGTDIIEELNLNVYATANTLRGLPKSLLSRFMVIRIKPYDKETAKRVMSRALVKIHHVDEELANYIAENIVEKLGSRDIRDAVKIAKIAKTKEKVDKYIKLWLEHIPKELYTNT